MKNKKRSAELERDLNKIIKIDKAQIHSHLVSMVREKVEDTLKGMFNEKAGRLYNAPTPLNSHEDVRVKGIAVETIESTVSFRAGLLK